MRRSAVKKKIVLHLKTCLSCSNSRVRLPIVYEGHRFHSSVVSGGRF